MLGVRNVWRQENQRRPKSFHVRHAFVSAVPPMTICTQNRSRCSVHGLNGIFHCLRYSIVLQQLLQSVSSRRIDNTRSLGQIFFAQLLNALSKSHATIFQKIVSRMALVCQTTNGRNHMECDPITTKTILHRGLVRTIICRQRIFHFLMQQADMHNLTFLIFTRTQYHLSKTCAMQTII